MRRQLRTASLCVPCVLVLALGSALAAPTWEQLQAHYAYDASAPLNVVVQSTEDRGQFVVETFQFTSVNNALVPGVLCKPKGTERPPLLLALHGYGGDGKGFGTQIAAFVCPKGVAVLAIDAQYHGGRKVAGKDIFSPDLPVTLEAIRQTVMDNRRAVDYAVSRGDLETDKLALVGASMGGILGSIVGGLDERIKSVFLIVGGGDLISLFLQSQHPAAARVKAALQDSPEAREAEAWVEPTNFVGHISPRPLLMLNGRDDQIVPRACGEALFAAAREPKRIVWYEGTFMGGHIPPLGTLFTEMKGFLQAAGMGNWTE